MKVTSYAVTYELMNSDGTPFSPMHRIETANVVADSADGAVVELKHMFNMLSVNVIGIPKESEIDYE